MSTLASHWPQVKAKHRYEIALSSTGEGIRQSGQVRWAISSAVGRSGDPAQYPIGGIWAVGHDRHVPELPVRTRFLAVQVKVGPRLERGSVRGGDAADQVGHRAVGRC